MYGALSPEGVTMRFFLFVALLFLSQYLVLLWAIPSPSFLAGGRLEAPGSSPTRMTHMVKSLPAFLFANLSHCIHLR